MEYLSAIVLVMALFLLGVVSPGPNFFVLIQESLNHGRKAGLVTGLGIAFGDLLYASAGLFGLTALINSVGWLFLVIKFLGGLYIFYLGIKLLANKAQGDQPTHTSPIRDIRLAHCFRLGLITDLSNPKTIVFFASIFATVVEPEMPHWVFAAMLAGIVGTSILWRTWLSFMFSRDLFRTFYITFRIALERIFGGFLVLFGLRMAAMAIEGED